MNLALGQSVILCIDAAYFAQRYRQRQERGTRAGILPPPDVHQA